MRSASRSQRSLFSLFLFFSSSILAIPWVCASSTQAKSLVPDVTSRHYSVNPVSNSVLACGSLIDLRSLDRVTHCFISLASTKGYWLNLGDLFSRVLGYDVETNYFILRDRQDKFFMLTRDGTHFHPINSDEGMNIMSKGSFQPSVNATNENTLLALSLIKQEENSVTSSSSSSTSQAEDSSNSARTQDHASNKDSHVTPNLDVGDMHEQAASSSPVPGEEENMVIDLLNSLWRSQSDFLISNENRVVSIWF